jgi:aminopeptidase N
MKKILFLFSLMAATTFSFAQPGGDDPKDTTWKTIYRATPEKINDLVHTKLDLRFDYAKKYAYGKAWITLKPHFYPTDSLRLDAKGMDIKKVALLNGTATQPLKYDYADGMNLRINLGRNYKASEQYTVYIEYTAKPNELKVKGSAAINDAKGLYFINPDGKEKDKPTQIWTQGETEASSVWFPTIDRPNQKTTEELTMTVPDKYVTLSNGIMIKSVKNADGTRSDTWKMDLPHAPYLFMMAIGDFKVVKDKPWKGKEISYYVEPAYEKYAKGIFGNTPEMIDFYSKTLGVDYAWPKYAQVIVHDYVSGAMENTSATLHGEFLNTTDRERLDGDQEEVIAHELFHQWFGDLVTCESWSNLTVNESFANFSEVMWAEHKYGQDEGDYINFRDMQGYIQSGSDKKNLVRFYYADKEDMFDAVSYNKGGRILYMLRNYLGRDAFYAGLKKYLTDNRFGTGEAHQLRLAMEAVSGKDLNWFFNQWYFGAGHPKLTIDYSYDEATKKAIVAVKQTQKDKIFKMPVAIDIYEAGKKTRHNVWIQNENDTFSFDYSVKPDLVNFDGDKMLLCEKKENKTVDNYVFQYKNCPLYLDRREALEALKSKQNEATARNTLIAALKDKYYRLRASAIAKLDLKNEELKAAAAPILEELALKDEKAAVRIEALAALDKLKDSKYESVFRKSLNDQSYGVLGKALTGLNNLKVADISTLASRFEKDHKGALTRALVNIYTANNDGSKLSVIAQSIDNLPLQSMDDVTLLGNVAKLAGKSTDGPATEKVVDHLKSIGKRFGRFGLTSLIQSHLKSIVDGKKAQMEAATPELKKSLESQADYAQKAIDELKNEKAGDE